MTEQQTRRNTAAQDLAQLIDPQVWQARDKDQHTIGAQFDFAARRSESLAAAERVVGAGLLASAPDTPGHHVMVTVDPARNCGAASITRTMVPLYAAIGLLLAGDTEDIVCEEYDLTTPELRLVAALAEEVRGFLAERRSAPELSGDVVATVADALSAVRLEIGDNTRSLIADGQWKQIHLSVSERRTIAEIAITAMPALAISREQVRTAAESLFRWNTEVPGQPRFVLHNVTEGVDREPHEVLVEQVLNCAGIEVTDD